MKHLLSLITFIAVAFLAASCSWDNLTPDNPSKSHSDIITPDELSKDDSKVAKTIIHFSDSEVEDRSASFSTAIVYRKTDKDGLSRLTAISNGTMVADDFFLYFHFNCIDKLKVGETLNLSDFYVLINPANHFIGYTMDYDGTITIAGKGDDYVILHFNKVKWSLSPWEYTTDGYLYCTLEDMLTI